MRPDGVPTSPEGDKRHRIEPDNKSDMLQKALVEDVDLIGDDADILIYKLICQLVTFKQRKINDKLSSSYKSNGKKYGLSRCLQTIALQDSGRHVHGLIRHSK